MANRGLIGRREIAPGERRLIGRVELGVNVTQAKIEFAIPPVGVGFEIVGYGACDQATIQYLLMRFNNDSDTNYTAEGGESTSVGPAFARAGGGGATSLRVGLVAPNSSPQRASAACHIRVFDHTNRDGVVMLASGAGLTVGVSSYFEWTSGTWTAGTGPVNLVHLFPATGNIMGRARFDCFLNG